MSDWRDLSFRMDRDPPVESRRILLHAWHAHEMAHDIHEQGDSVTVAALTIGHRHDGGDKAHSHVDEWGDWLDVVSAGPGVG